MILAAFLISTAGVLFALFIIQSARHATREHARETLEGLLDGFLEGAVAKDSEHGTGTYHGMPVAVTLDHIDARFEVRFETAIVPYTELVERHAPPELKLR